MFGLYRTYLAIAVMAFHLLGVPVVGPYAVFAFFALSGFLMTMIMAETYGHNRVGITAFAVNRALRLYPAYWIAATLSVAIIVFTGADFARGYKEALAIPSTAIGWLANIGLIFPKLAPYHFQPRLSPPTWALTVEIVYYGLIAFGISRTPRRTMFWCIASLVYLLLTFVTGAGPESRFGYVTAGSLPFSLGAWAYWARHGISRRVAPVLGRSALPVIVAQVLIMTAGSWLAASRPALALDIGLIGTALMSPVLIVQLHDHGIPGIGRSVDKWIGDFSYPIYLLHWPVSALVTFLLLGRPVHGAVGVSFTVFVLTLLIVVLLSYALIALVDPAIDIVRARMRQSVVARRRTPPGPDTAGATGVLARRPGSAD